MSVNCVACKQSFSVSPSIIKRGGGKYCRLKCYRSFMKTGIYRNNMSKIAIRKNYGKWSKGRKKPDGAYSFPEGENNPSWLGNAVGYRGIHNWINNHATKRGICSNCEVARKTVWANISHKYRRDTDDWIELCQSCNINYDLANIQLRGGVFV